ncbi:M1 family metallopeptidase [Flavobacterium sp. ASW18X]|uniref:M1 family metallopeptidase n=1 Tax=Flavobacterium sp. ASW18X TaxID=2572595 RepID=UPI0010AE308B|nr:M1 family metallopeptidase [Flavobacterium sp. ASW18X]TKD65950.1 M1 family metallopeptidase [Flavobacterium sp. ASW18X]
MRFFSLLLFCWCLSGFAQKQQAVDFIHAAVAIEPNGIEKTVQGSVEYTFLVQRKVDSIFLDAENINIINFRLNDTTIEYVNTGKKLGFKSPKKPGEYSLYIDYLARPKQTVYFFGWDDVKVGNEQIWTQGQGKYTRHWLPSFDDMTEKVEFDLSITAPKHLAVIANGELKSKTYGEDKQTWSWNMEHPMSSYLVAFAIVDFKKETRESSTRVPIDLYYNPKDSSRVAPTYKYTTELFNFLEQEIGVPYPWQNYKQVPVHDFMYGGMENTSCTLFSDQYMIDEKGFVDKNYVNVNAHELAHQWFGNLVTEVSGAHHWLQEGFATYYAYLAEKEVFGDDYYYWKLYETAQNLIAESEKGNGESLLDPKASSLTFYEKGAWALILLKDLVGDKAFKKGIQTYLLAYSYKNATVADFLAVMEKASGKDLEEFRKKWLVASEFPKASALAYLKKKDPSIKRLEELATTIESSTVITKENVTNFYDSKAPIGFKKEFIKRYVNQLDTPTLQKILMEGELLVRQAIIANLEQIPAELQTDFETLLKDDSYLTQEYALLALWQQFPERGSFYLDSLSTIEGLPNKSLRILWLTLALVTEQYNSSAKKQYYEELNAFTAPEYNFEVRINAFRYLNQIQALSDSSLRNLVQATQHHSWQFRLFAKRQLQHLVSLPNMVARLEDLQPSLSETEKELISKLLTE